MIEGGLVPMDAERRRRVVTMVMPWPEQRLGGDLVDSDNSSPLLHQSSGQYCRLLVYMSFVTFDVGRNIGQGSPIYPLGVTL